MENHTSWNNVVLRSEEYYELTRRSYDDICETTDAAVWNDKDVTCRMIDAQAVLVTAGKYLANLSEKSDEELPSKKDLMDFARAVTQNCMEHLEDAYTFQRNAQVREMNLHNYGIFRIDEWNRAEGKNKSVSTKMHYRTAWHSAMNFEMRNMTNSKELELWAAPNKCSKAAVSEYVNAFLIRFCDKQRQEGNWTLQTTQTNAVCLHYVAKNILEYEVPDFAIYLQKLGNEVRHNHEYKILDDAALEKELMCKDGTLLTTQKLQTAVQDSFQVLQQSTDVTFDQVFKVLLVALHAFLGNRPEDYCVGYTEKHAMPINGSGRAWFDPLLSELVYENAGKMKASYPKRSSIVPVFVANVIAMCKDVYEKETGKPYTALLPPVATWKCPVDGIRRYLRKALLFVGVDKVVSSNTLRHLFETHCLYAESMEPAKYEMLMNGIGHRKSMSTKRYSQLYRGLVAHPLGYGLDSSGFGVAEVLAKMKTMAVADDKEEKEDA